MSISSQFEACAAPKAVTGRILKKNLPFPMVCMAPTGCRRTGLRNRPSKYHISNAIQRGWPNAFNRHKEKWNSPNFKPFFVIDTEQSTKQFISHHQLSASNLRASAKSRAASAGQGPWPWQGCEKATYGTLSVKKNHKKTKGLRFCYFLLLFCCVFIPCFSISCCEWLNCLQFSTTFRL